MEVEVVLIQWKDLVFVDMTGRMEEGIKAEEEQMSRAVAVKSCNTF